MFLGINHALHHEAVGERALPLDELQLWFQAFLDRYLVVTWTLLRKKTQDLRGFCALTPRLVRVHNTLSCRGAMFPVHPFRVAALPQASRNVLGGSRCIIFHGCPWGSMPKGGATLWLRTAS